MSRIVTTRYLLGVACCLALGAPLCAAPDRPINQVRVSEEAVKRLPLSKRPNRIGHFYGNTVRRLEQGKLCVNCGKHARPVARYLYVTR